MTEVDYIQLLFNYGFPAGIATYVIVRLEPAMKQLTVAVTNLAAIVESTGRRCK